MAPLHIVALGSSFAAGPGVTPIIDAAAGRSAKNYAHLVAERMDARLTDLSCSGATLLNVLDESQQLMTTTVPAQLSSFPSDADIVTLTAGGNDLGYSRGMIVDAAKASLDKAPWLEDYLETLSGGATDQPTLSTQDLTDRFIRVIDKVKSIAPKARIILVEYLTVFGSNASLSDGNLVKEDRMQHYREEATRLQTAYRSAAKARPGIELLPASDLSEDHGVSSKEPWVTGFSATMLLKGATPFHPNASGHEAIAQELFQLLNVGKPSGGAS